MALQINGEMDILKGGVLFEQGFGQMTGRRVQAKRVNEPKGEVRGT